MATAMVNDSELYPQQQRQPLLLRLSDRRFLVRVVLATWLLRLMIVVILQLTDAVFILRLSPDSERYHREGLRIAQEMEFGNFNWPNWIDNGWFQFTGFVYWLIGPYDWLIQVINITMGALTVVPLFLIARQIVDDKRIQRFYALLVAFFPSLIYWSVLGLKDPASGLAVALAMYAVFTLRLRFSLWAALFYVAALAILMGTRTYLAFVVLLLTGPALLAFPYRAHRHTARIVMLSLAVGLLPLAAGYGYFGINYVQQSLYFDLEYINHVRVAMGDHGSGALFAADDVHVWGNDIGTDILAAIRTVLSVFIPVNPFDVGSVRQFIALPFVFLMMYLMVPMFRGFRYAWRVRALSAPIMLFTCGVLGVYVSGTTNSGALFRWTTQIMPYFLMAIAIGFFYRPDLYTSRVGTRLVRAWL